MITLHFPSISQSVIGENNECQDKRIYLKFTGFPLYPTFTWFSILPQPDATFCHYFWPKIKLYFSYLVHLCKACNFKMVFCYSYKTFKETMWSLFNHFYVISQPSWDQLTWVFDIFIIS